jgi:hypothetical protein
MAFKEEGRQDIEVTLTKSDTGTGYGTALLLSDFPLQGALLYVSGREDATNKDMATGYVFIAKTATIDANLDENDIVYQSDLITFTGSATVASLKESIANGAQYKVHDHSTLYAAIQVVTAGGGGSSTDVYCRFVVQAFGG